MKVDIAVVGAGCAGMTAALYAARAGKNVAIFESESIGGQISRSPKVENWPSIISISGAEFSNNLYNQIAALGVNVYPYDIKGITKNNAQFILNAGKKEILAGSVIIATGVTHKNLSAKNLDKFDGKGVSYCAVCDGAFYAGENVAVIGDGNTAVQYAIMLSGYCETVNLCMWSEQCFADLSLQENMYKKSNIIIHKNYTVYECIGDDELSAIIIKNNLDTKQIDVKAMFVAIGHIPQNKKFENIVLLDDSGYIVADESCETSCDGIFVAGDCRTKQLRQLTTASSDGAMAATQANAFLNAKI